MTAKTVHNSPLTIHNSQLITEFGDRLCYNELMSKHCTFKLGGRADLWLMVKNISELIKAVGLARQHNIPIFILGGGTNLLISDDGIRGLVIQNRSGQVEINPNGKVTVDSGVILSALVSRFAKQGLSGLEWAATIPGTVGGAVINNAGAYGGDIANILIRAELLSPDGERIWQPVDWFEYEYRSSRLKGQHNKGWIVLQTEMQLAPAPLAEIKARTAEFNRKRKVSQPGGATTGSTFRNPPGDYAGRLIEAVGLRGYRLGQAQISERHANFFQNLGGATATEMFKLIKIARTKVKQKFGVELQLEIEIIGEFIEKE